ncbi:MAG: tripartite tricarboxylate transporter substrate binding protein [Advenella sp.]|nr:tripartite tricarboxylate transporter substrate binding protein [Advenella sp. FME57]
MKKNVVIVAAANMLALTGLLFTPAASGAGKNDTYPDKPIQLVVGYGAGGGTDMCFRALAQGAAEKLGQSIVVENKPGAGSSLSISYIARQKPDGYTLAALSTGAVLNQFLVKNISYDVGKDLTPIAMMAQYQVGVLVRADSPYHNVADLIAAAKKKSMTYSTAGVGTPQHLAMEKLGGITGGQWIHTPYKSGIEASTGLMRGDVDFMTQTAEWAPYVRDKRLRLLAVFTNKRIDEFNQAPTMQEAGFDIVAPSIFGLVGPKGMDPAIVRKLDDAFHHAMSTSTFKNCANQFGLMIDYRNASDFARHIDNTAVQWGPAAAELKK